MKLMVNHQTHYAYTAAVSRSIQYIKMTPPNTLHQKVHVWDVCVPGHKEVKYDAFDNIWLTCSQQQAYQQMSIMAQGTVEINRTSQQGRTDHLNPYIFLQPTETTLCNEEMRDFAESHVTYLDRTHLMRLAEALLARIPYVAQQTCANTSAIQAFEHGQGVCQDHSHIFIGMCKHLGLPARYVSGYLYVQDMTHLASHAWAEVFLEGAWYCFDISNQLFSPDSHVYVAIGRDYWDVAPVRGVRASGGEESMHSIVQVLSY
jgi:transglutaminase-like putative cysteine protease